MVDCQVLFMKNYRSILSERLKLLRAERGLTMPQLGQIVGVKKQAIDNLEKGESRPSFDLLCALADALDVSLDYLVGRSDDPKAR